MYRSMLIHHPLADFIMSETSTICVPLSAESLTIQERLNEANKQKAEGNDYFHKAEWTDALSAYKSALSYLPKKITKKSEERLKNSVDDDRGDGEPALDSETQIPSSSQSLEVPNTDEKMDTEIRAACSTLRSVLNGNIGASHLKLGEHKESVEACTQALADDPNYIKARQRRAASNEVINSWSSLTSAQEDYNELLKLLPPGAERRDVETKLRRLKPRVEAARESETAEMVDKLKGLGNSILGKFGLSTENFKFEPNGQGGYSVNFNP